MQLLVVSILAALHTAYLASLSNVWWHTPVNAACGGAHVGVSNQAYKSNGQLPWPLAPACLTQ